MGGNKGEVNVGRHKTQRNMSSDGIVDNHQRDGSTRAARMFSGPLRKTGADQQKEASGPPNKETKSGTLVSFS